MGADSGGEGRDDAERTVSILFGRRGKKQKSRTRLGVGRIVDFDKTCFRRIPGFWAFRKPGFWLSKYLIKSGFLAQISGF